MSHLKTLVAMQLRDKIDLSSLKSTKSVLRSFLLSTIKFLVVVFAVYTILSASQLLGIFYYSETPQVMNLVLTFCMVLSLFSCTWELMKNLFVAEDNKVLITFPVNANKIFVSKIIVFYLYEIKKSFGFLIPITVGCLLLMVNINLCSPLVFLWMIFPLLILILIPVLLGSILSIILFFIYRFVKSHFVVQIILFVSVVVGGIFLIISLIGLIPSEINLLQLWPQIRAFITDVLFNFESKLTIFRLMIYTIIGYVNANMTYVFTYKCLLGFLGLFGICILLYLINYFVSRPIFFRMMSKSFEINKSTSNERPNKQHNKYIAFINKEMLINFRTIEISVSYLSVYIMVPMLILLINTIYKAIDANDFGRTLIYVFNILLISLPLLASNSKVASYYSREGRAGYMKKTKPIYAAYPLLAKLFFNVLFSIPTVLITVGIFGTIMDISIPNYLFLSGTILFLHLGHMIVSAKLDIMNPQNEQYATTGGEIDNPNENKSTLLAFIISILFAVVAYKLLDESLIASKSYTFGCFKLFIISLTFFGLSFMMFMKRIKAFYYEIQG